MDAFEYLSVLLSIVLGLALTNLLTGIARLVQLRAQARLYWPALVWAASLLLIIVQSWWAMFDVRDHAGWTLLKFAVLLVHPTLLYFMCVLILPDPEREGTLDLRRNYYTQAPWFFGAASLVIVASLMRPLAFDGAIPWETDTAFQLGFLAVTLTAALVRKPRLHEAVAVIAPAGLLIYSGALFFQLR